jgi:hypothetical protein
MVTETLSESAWIEEAKKIAAEHRLIDDDNYIAALTRILVELKSLVSRAPTSVSFSLNFSKKTWRQPPNAVWCFYIIKIMIGCRHLAEIRNF